MNDTDSNSSPILPPNTIQALMLPGVESLDPHDYIRPAHLKRDWMDQVPGKYIYRCIPLIAANTMGWELLNPVTSKVKWDGGVGTQNLNISEPRHRFGASSHFGNGIVTWYVPFLFRTSPDLGLLVSGPANHEHNHAVPLEAFVRTDWLPFPFTLNWRLTRQDQQVIFKEKEVLARITPYPLALLDETSLEIGTLTQDPVFMQEVNAFGKARAQNVVAQQENARKAQDSGEEVSMEGVYNAQYVKAKGKKKGEGFTPHQSIFKPAPIVDKRD